MGLAIIKHAWAFLVANKWARGGLIVLAAGIAFFFWLQAHDRRVRQDLLNQLAAEQAQADAAQRAIENKAAVVRSAEVTAAEGVITANRKELDNETIGLPDQAPSARTRSRVCAELRRQANGKDHPSCR